MLSQAYLQPAQYELNQAKNSIEISKLSLSQILGLPTTQDLQISEAVPTVDHPETPQFEKLANETWEHQQILATIDANMAGIGVAKSAFFPSLNLTGSTGVEGPRFFPNQTDRWSIAATLSIPLFNGGKDISSLKSATDSRNSSMARQIQVDQDSLSNLKQTFHKYLEAIEKLKVDESFEKAAVVRSEVARGQYSNGLISFTDWDQVENDLILRQKNYIQSKKDRVLSEAAWNQAQGQGVLK